MRIPVCLLVAVAVVCPVWAAGPPMTPGWADRLVEQLGDDDFDTREAAAKALDKAGGDAVPALRRGMQSKHAVIRFRSLKIAKAIEARTVAYYEALGAEVRWSSAEFGRISPVEQLFLQGLGIWLNEYRYNYVHALTFQDRDSRRLRDEHLRELAGLPWLAELNLSKAPIGDEGMRYLGLVKHLSRLVLNKTNVSDNGLAHLSESTQLEWLSLHDTRNITGSGFVHLGKLRKLTGLGLTRSGITDLGIKLGIPGIKKMSNLKFLCLSQTQISDAGLVQFKKLSQPLDLSLDQTKISDRGIASLKAMDNLKAVDLAGTAITDEGCTQLAEINTLQGLRLGYTEVTLKGLTKLKQLPELRRLEISGIRLRRYEVFELLNTLTNRVKVDGNQIRRFQEKP